MNSFRSRIGLALAAALLMFSGHIALAAAEAAASPEPGDAPVEMKTVTPSTTAEAPIEAETPPPAATTDTASAPSVTPRISQRVDGTNTEEIIRLTPRPRKNVTRIDNRPDRPKVRPIAVIHGPVAPWGYASRYMSGQIDRPAAKDLQNSGPQQQGLGQNNVQGAARGAAPTRTLGQNRAARIADRRD